MTENNSTFQCRFQRAGFFLRHPLSLHTERWWMHQIFLVPQLQILRDLPSDEISSGWQQRSSKKKLKACSTPFYTTSGYCSEIFVWVHHMVFLKQSWVSKLQELPGLDPTYDKFPPLDLPRLKWNELQGHLQDPLHPGFHVLFWCPTRFLPEKKQLIKKELNKKEMKPWNNWDFFGEKKHLLLIDVCFSHSSCNSLTSRPTKKGNPWINGLKSILQGDVSNVENLLWHSIDWFIVHRDPYNSWWPGID